MLGVACMMNKDGGVDESEEQWSGYMVNVGVELGDIAKCDI